MMCFGGTRVERGEDGVSVSQVRTSTGHKIVDTSGNALVQLLIDRFLIRVSRKELYFWIKRCEDWFRV